MNFLVKVPATNINPIHLARDTGHCLYPTNIFACCRVGLPAAGGSIVAKVNFRFAVDIEK